MVYLEAKQEKKVGLSVTLEFPTTVNQESETFALKGIEKSLNNVTSSAIDIEAGGMLKINPPMLKPEMISLQFTDDNDKELNALKDEDAIQNKGNDGKDITVIDRFNISDDASKETRKGCYLPDKQKVDLANISLKYSDPFNVESNFMSTETIKAKVFTEYFSMIDDLVLVADMKLNIISNNYLPKIVESVIKKFNMQKKRVNIENLIAPVGTIHLDECFRFVENEMIKCSEETIMNLIDIYSVLNYKQKKYNPEDVQRFKELKIESILKKIEILDNGIKISNKQEENVQNSLSNSVSKLRSSMKAINVKNSNLTVTYS